MKTIRLILLMFVVITVMGLPGFIIPGNSVEAVAKDCSPWIVVSAAEGNMPIPLLMEYDRTVKVSETSWKCGPWSAWGPWGDKCLFIRARHRSRVCTKTITYDKRRYCEYFGSSCPGFIGHAITYRVLKTYTKTLRRRKADYEFDLDPITLPEDYTRHSPGTECHPVLVGSTLSVSIPPELEEGLVESWHWIDGQEVALGEHVYIDQPGEHLWEGKFLTETGEEKTVVVSFMAVQPVTVAEYTIYMTYSAAAQVWYNMRLQNNDMEHERFAAVSVVPPDEAAVVARIEGPEYYILPPGGSAQVTIIAHLFPGSWSLKEFQSINTQFTIQVSSPTAIGDVTDDTILTYSALSFVQQLKEQLEIMDAAFAGTLDPTGGRLPSCREIGNLLVCAVIDDDQQDESFGNDDHIIHPGEDIEIKFAVRNLSAETIKELRIKSELAWAGDPGIEVQEGRTAEEDLGDLETRKFVVTDPKKGDLDLSIDLFVAEGTIFKVKVTLLSQDKELESTTFEFTVGAKPHS